MRWNRLVAGHKDETKCFPSFKMFVDFVCKEAKIASNPVTSLNSLKEFQESDSRTQTKGQRVQRGHTNVNNPVGSRSFFSNSRDSGQNTKCSSNNSIQVLNFRKRLVSYALELMV